MTDYVPFEDNEVSVNSQGGTERTKRSIAALIDPSIASNFQIVCSRPRELLEDKIRVLWLHDLPNDTEIQILATEEGRSKWHRLVFSSNWQHQQFVDHMKIPWSVDHAVIDTPVDPIRLDGPKSFDDGINLIYFSTPNRGLEVLLPVFEKLCETSTEKLHLDVFSSFKIYGWDEMDKQYEPLYERCRRNPNITYHGFAPNEEVRACLARSHIFAYPSIWQETSCRCLIESMSAGLVCVHPAYGALADTSGGLTAMYPMDSSIQKHADLHYVNLMQAIQNVKNERVQEYLKFVKAYADSRFNLEKSGKIWEGFLKTALNTYWTIESRTFPKLEKVFRYRTV